MIRFTTFLFIAAVGFVAFSTLTDQRDRHEAVAVPQTMIDLGLELNASQDTQGETAAPVKESFGIQIRRPLGPPVVRLDGGGPLGEASQVACSTCHSVREANLDNRDDTTLDQFHQGLKVNHGKLACYACHNPQDADSLRSADGERIAYQDVMKLCAQCHSPQATAFEHGAHGGMNGFWDPTRGPQTKNNCIDCHDPHGPRYPKMIVDFKPLDRFLEGGDSHDDHP